MNPQTFVCFVFSFAHVVSHSWIPSFCYSSTHHERSATLTSIIPLSVSRPDQPNADDKHRRANAADEYLELYFAMMAALPTFHPVSQLLCGIPDRPRADHPPRDGSAIEIDLVVGPKKRYDESPSASTFPARVKAKKIILPHGTSENSKTAMLDDPVSCLGSPDATQRRNWAEFVKSVHLRHEGQTSRIDGKRAYLFLSLSIADLLVSLPTLCFLSFLRVSLSAARAGLFDADPTYRYTPSPDPSSGHSHPHAPTSLAAEVCFLARPAYSGRVLVASTTRLVQYHQKHTGHVKDK